MSAAIGAAHHEPGKFEFTPDNLELAQRIIAKYPPGRQQSAVMPLLDLAQRQSGNWLPQTAIDHVADMLEMPRIRAHEVATFYTMYNLKPVGRHFIQICTTTPCWLRGSDGIVDACEKKLGVKLGGTTDDGQFTIKEVECLGACVNAPMVQINDDFYEDLTPETMAEILDMLARGETPKDGPQTDRIRACPQGGPTSLIEQARRVGVKPAGQV